MCKHFRKKYNILETRDNSIDLGIRSIVDINQIYNGNKIPHHAGVTLVIW